MESFINNLAQNDRLVLLIIAHVQSQEKNLRRILFFDLVSLRTIFSIKIKA